MVSASNWTNWGHTESISPADWDEVREYIDVLAKWDQYRKKFPKAFASFALNYNQQLAALEVLTRMKAGTGIAVTWSDRDVQITNTRPS